MTVADGNDAVEPQDVIPTAATDTVDPTVFSEVEVELLKRVVPRFVDSRFVDQAMPTPPMNN